MAFNFWSKKKKTEDIKTEEKLEILANEEEIKEDLPLAAEEIKNLEEAFCEKQDEQKEETIKPLTEADETEELKEEPAFCEDREKDGFFARLKNSLAKTKNAITERIDGVFSAFKVIDDDLFEELEEVLIMADIGQSTSELILDELKRKIKEEGIKEPEGVKTALKAIISDILKGTNSEMNLSGSPAVIVVIGVNGVGKTTSIGKMAAMYKAQGKKVILAAADTFRAAAIDQLEIWAERAGVDIVKYREGADPSSVVFDAIASAKAKGADLVICDTAGRLHNKKPLMEELKKVARVIERESGSSDFESLLVLDGSTGQNALIQAREFAQVSHITGVVLTKLDGTAKGGVIIPLAKEQNIGVKFIGIGEKIDDLRPFDPVQFADALFSND